MTSFPVARDSKVYVAGHRGMVGAAILRKLKEDGFTKIVTRTSSELDLRNRKSVFEFFESEKPEIVFLAAAKVGGILANDTYPADFLSDNLQIQLNVMDAANAHECDRLVFLGSSCIYPKFAPQPIPEEALMTGHLERTNDAYAVAKIAGVQQVMAVRKQYHRGWVAIMPCNLYGPGDNYDPERSHVLPSLIQRYHRAKAKGLREVTNWGTGSPLREFLHVDDLAEACLVALEAATDYPIINVGSGNEVTIRYLAELVSQLVGYNGETYWDDRFPDGTPRKLLDSSKITNMGWAPNIDLAQGLASVIKEIDGGGVGEEGERQ